MTPIRVVVVDDHEVLRSGLRMMLESSTEIRVVGEAEDGLRAIEVVQRLRPDVVLLDVKMPNEDGLSALRHLRTVEPELPVLILSMYDEPAYVEEAISSGASGYLIKTVSGDELVRAIRAAYDGQGYLQAEITRPVLSRFSRIHETSLDVRLSPRETEVLRLIADGMHTKEIARALDISEATVKTYITSLFEKLGAVHRAHAVALALRHQLID